jgi:ABC-type transport system substrate-binding protein
MKHVDYEREGMAFVSFAAERALVSTAGVRRAIAYSLDEDKLIDDFLGERGTRVYGFYGSKIANDPQWRPYVNRIPRYQLDLSAAIAELEKDGFVYDAAGELYTAQSE